MHSLATKVCEIKKLAVNALDNEGKRNDAYDDSELRRYAEQEPDIALFLNAPLWQQYRIQCHQLHAPRLQVAARTGGGRRTIPSSVRGQGSGEPTAGALYSAPQAN